MTEPSLVHPGSPQSELLAPAGSIESFFAAMEAGADAVYCGLKEFSARAKAKNFTLAEMERLTSYAHRQGRRLYVTANTLIKEAELPRLIEVLASLASIKIDGLIIQDLGLWRIAHSNFPEIPLHASTQLAIHNAAGVKILEKMGFSRAVLARELSLQEISAIGRQTTIELEHFIHGALCYSISGQCFFSSYISGKSGNRGRCVQPCRRRYSLGDQEGFHFSTSDLCAIEFMPQLLTAGIMSFKIEGRMKNAEYVHTVVSAYRTVLDAKGKNLQKSMENAREMLTQSFGRQTTSGFLTGKDSQSVVSSSREAGIGLQLGQVAQIRAGSVFFTTNQPVHVGDRLRIQPESDMTGMSFTVKELFIGNKKSKRAAPGNFVGIPSPFSKKFNSGDHIYKVSSGKGFTLSEEACQRRLAAVTAEASPVNLTASFEGSCLSLEARCCGQHLCQQYMVDMIAAKHSPLSRETLLRTFEKTGHATLALESLTADNLPPVVIQPSRLKEIRRNFFGKLAPLIKEVKLKNLQERINQAQETLLEPVATQKTSATLTVRLKNVPNKAILGAPGVDTLLIALSPKNMESLNKHPLLSEHHHRISWDIPAIIYEGYWSPMQQYIDQLIDMGFKTFRLNNLGHFHFFNGQTTNVQIQAGPLLYALNSCAVISLQDLGAEEFTFSVEDDKINITNLLCRSLPLPASAVVYSPIPLLTSRIAMPAEIRQQKIENDRGETMRLDFSSDLTEVFAGKNFSLLGRLHELQGKGCGKFIVDLADADDFSSQVQSVLHAFTNDLPLPNTSSFNFDRGLE